jgi:hypothetical protein
MGRRKIAIKKLDDDRTRKVTFTKRKGGLMKKAMELAILCDSETFLVTFSSTGKMYAYASHDPASTFARFEKYRKDHTEFCLRSSADYVDTFGASTKDPESPLPNEDKGSNEAGAAGDFGGGRADRLAVMNSAMNSALPQSAIPYTDAFATLYSTGMTPRGGPSANDAMMMQFTSQMPTGATPFMLPGGTGLMFENAAAAAAAAQGGNGNDYVPLPSPIDEGGDGDSGKHTGAAPMMAQAATKRGKSKFDKSKLSVAIPGGAAASGAPAVAVMAAAANALKSANNGQNTNDDNNEGTGTDEEPSTSGQRRSGRLSARPEGGQVPLSGMLGTGGLPNLGADLPSGVGFGFSFPAGASAMGTGRGFVQDSPAGGYDMSAAMFGSPTPFLVGDKRPGSARSDDSAARRSRRRKAD